MKLIIFYKYFCVLLLYVLLLSSCSKPVSNYTRKEVVFLEINTDLSSISQYTKHFQNGVKLALNEINRKGGINGKKVIVFHRNDFLNFVTAKKAIVESKDTKILAAFGTYFSMPSLGAIEGANQIKLPFLNCGYDDSYIYSNYNNYSYHLRPGLQSSLKALAKEASKIPNLNRWLIITYSNDKGIKAGKVFEKELITLLSNKQNDKISKNNLKELGYIFKYIYISPFKKYDLSSSNNLDKALSNTKAVLIITNGKDIQGLIDNSNLKQKLLNKIVFYPFAGEPEWFQYTSKALTPENWIVTGYPWYSINNISHKVFYSNYYNTYNMQPRYASILGYISLYILVNVAKQIDLNEPDIYKLRNKFNKCLANMTLKGTPLGDLSVRKDHIIDMGIYTGIFSIYTEQILNKYQQRMILKDIRMQDLLLYTSNQIHLPEDQVIKKIKKFSKKRTK